LIRQAIVPLGSSGRHAPDVNDPRGRARGGLLLCSGESRQHARDPALSCLDRDLGNPGVVRARVHRRGRLAGQINGRPAVGCGGEETRRAGCRRP